MRKICTKFAPRVPIEDQKEIRCHGSREMIELINSDPAVLDALVTCDESSIYCYDPETKRQSSHMKYASSLRPKMARQCKSTHKLLMIPFFFGHHWHDLHALGSQRQTVNREYYVEVLREFRKRFNRKRQALFESGQWHFHKDNAPVHNSILDTDYLTKMEIKRVSQPPYCPDLGPYDICLFPKLRGWRYETIEEMKEAVMKVIDKGLRWGLPEVLGTVQQVHCSWRRLLRRGLEIRVCTINKSGHTKKVWKLI